MTDRGRFWNEQAETLPRDLLEKVQLTRLQKQLRYCYDHSPYYRQKLVEAGAEPEDITTWAEFRRLPVFLTKEVDRFSQQQSRETLGHPFGMYHCAPLEKIIAVHSTSGTTGIPTFYSFTQHDIDIQNEALARAFWRVGMRPGDGVIHGFGLSMWLAGLPLLRCFQHMGVRAIPVGAEAGAERFLTLAGLTRPDWMVCTPSFAEYLIKRAPEVVKAEVGDLMNLKGIVVMGEPGAGLPEVRRRIQEAYGCRLYDGAGGVWGMMTVSCDAEEYQGLHIVSEDLCAVHDIVDPDTKEPIPWTDGAIGEQVTTALEWEASPALRYAFGDILQIFTDPCPCGLPGWRMKILGRVDDLLIVKGVNVYPVAIKDVVAAFQPRVTGEMRIILEVPPPRVVPPLRMRVEHGNRVSSAELPSLKEEIEKRVSSALRVHPEIELVPPSTLKRDPAKKLQLLERRYLDQ